jgi:hypothetical protein
MAQLVPSEVKGVWFVSMRDYVQQTYGSEMLEMMLGKAPAEFCDVYREPIASAWYPEATLQDIHRMFQLLLGASSPGFVLRMVPTLWRQIRRGAGQVDVEQHGNHTLVHYSEFPWFRDRLYRLMTLASLRVILRNANRADPRIEVIEHGHAELSLRIAHREILHERPAVRRASTRPPAAP